MTEYFFKQNTSDTIFLRGSLRSRARLGVSVNDLTTPYTCEHLTRTIIPRDLLALAFLKPLNSGHHLRYQILTAR